MRNHFTLAFLALTMAGGCSSEAANRDLADDATSGEAIAHGEQTDVAQAVETYGRAWASRDVGAILDLHAENTEFVLHVAGAEPAIGKPAIREAFAQILADNPDYASEPKDMKLGPDFVVITYEITTGPDRPFILGGTRFGAETSDYRIPAIDVIAFEDGLVTSKHTFIDTETVRANVTAASVAER